MSEPHNQRRIDKMKRFKAEIFLETPDGTELLQTRYILIPDEKLESYRNRDGYVYARVREVLPNVESQS